MPYFSVGIFFFFLLESGFVMLGGMYLQGDRSCMCVVGIQFPSPTPPLGMFRFHYDESLDIEFVSRHRRRYRLQGPTYWIKTVPYNNNLVP